MIVLLVLTALLIVGFTALSIRRDARWMGNAALVIACLLVGEALIVWGTGAAAPLIVLVEIGVLLLSPILVLVLAGFLLHNGMQMIRKEGRSLGNLLSLLAGLTIIALEILAIAVLVVRDPQLTAPALFILLAAAYLGLELVAFLLYSFIYSRVVRGRRADYVIALGSGLKNGRVVTPLLAGRVDRAIAVYSDQIASGGRPRLVMSGGRGSDEQVSEAWAMREYALEQGVPQGDVLLEERSANTEQNLLYSRDVMLQDHQRALPVDASGAQGGDAQRGGQRRGSSIVGELGRGRLQRVTAAEPRAMIVTSDYHAMRAATLARRLGLKADAVGARTARYYWPSAVLREFMAMLMQHKKRHAVMMALFCLPLPVLFAVI